MRAVTFSPYTPLRNAARNSIRAYGAVSLGKMSPTVLRTQLAQNINRDRRQRENEAEHLNTNARARDKRGADFGKAPRDNRHVQLPHKDRENRREELQECQGERPGGRAHCRRSGCPARWRDRNHFC